MKLLKLQIEKNVSYFELKVTHGFLGYRLHRFAASPTCTFSQLFSFVVQLSLALSKALL